MKRRQIIDKLSEDMSNLVHGIQGCQCACECGKISKLTHPLSNIISHNLLFQQLFQLLMGPGYILEALKAMGGESLEAGSTAVVVLH